MAENDTLTRPCAWESLPAEGNARVVLQLMRDVFRALRSESSDRWAHLDLTIPQWRAFLAIAHEPDQSVGATARRLGVGLPAASHTVDRLVRAGLVTRLPHPEDRRQVLCRLSPAGEELFRDLSSLSTQTLVTWLERMDEEDIAALARGLSALVAVARAHGTREEVGR
jgi:DNA-binding MarR family transcriptional regulator